MSAFGTMVKTWLTGSGRPGLRKRALTRRSVISESLGKSTVLSDDGFCESEGVGGIFFILEFPSRFKKPLTPCSKPRLVGGVQRRVER